MVKPDLKQEGSKIKYGWSEGSNTDWRRKLTIDQVGARV